MLKISNIKFLSEIKHIVILLSVLLCNSCADEAIPADSIGTKIQNAVLEWHGDYAADGCGFFIIINDETYKPENEEEIGAQFKKSQSMNVLVKYAETNTFKHFYCGDNLAEYSIQSIRIIWIKSS